MRATRGPYAARTVAPTNPQQPRPEFAPNAPPICQRCWTIRHAAGSFISRLIFRPGALLKCIDCGVTIFDDRPKKKAA